MRRSTTTRFAMIALAAFASVAVASPAMAGEDPIERTGNCSGSADWKLKAKPDNGGLEIEFEVDSNVVGQTWQYRIIDNGRRLSQGTRTTTGPSGSFEVEIHPANMAGPDRITAQARNNATGETCVGKLTHP